MKIMLQASRWVQDVCRQAGYFGEKLQQVAGLTEHHRSQVQHADTQS